MVDYLLIMAALGATIIGIIGNTWDNTKRGMRKLTSAGRVALICALLAAVGSVYSSVSKQKELNWQEEQRERIQDVAHRELVAATGWLIDVLNEITDKHAQNLKNLGSPRWYADLFRNLSDTSNIRLIGECVLVSDNNVVSPKMTELVLVMKRADRAFKFVQTTYAQFLDADTHILLTEIQKDPCYNRWVELVDQKWTISDGSPAEGLKVKTLWEFFGDITSFPRFIEKLRTLVDHVGDKPFPQGQLSEQ